MTFKAECTVTLKGNETIEAAAYREVSEALSKIADENPGITLSIQSWEFTPDISVKEWREKNG